MFWKWEERQTGAWTDWAALFFPHGDLDTSSIKRVRAASVALHLRSLLRNVGHGTHTLVRRTVSE